MILKPSPEISPYIKMFWGMEYCKSSGQVNSQRIIPNGLIELSFYFEAIPSSENRKGFGTFSSYVSGQCNSPFDLDISGKLHIFSVLFKPYGASAFLKLPVSEIMNQTVALQQLIGNRANTLEQQIFDSKSLEEKAKIFEDFFLKQIQTQNNYDLNRIVNAVKFAGSNGGNVDVNKQALSACLSRKQFERKFSEYVGLPPKQFNRVVRFQRAIYFYQIKGYSNLTALACDSGYFDQAHMTNEFKQLSGLTPKQFFTDCEPISDYYL